MKKIIARLKREPILTRAGLAAVLNVLVISGLIDSGMSDAVEVAIVDVVALVLAISGRSKVTPFDVATEVFAVAPKWYSDAHAIAQASRKHAAK